MLGPNTASRQVKKPTDHPAGSPRCGIFISCFYSLKSRSSDTTLFVSFLGELLRRSFDPHGQQARRDIDAYANILRSVNFMTASICRSVLCQPERILIYPLHPEESHYMDFCAGENVFMRVQEGRNE